MVRSTDRLNRPQRIVVVIALGIACGAVGIYLINLGSTAGFGWYAYAPLATAAYPARAGLPGWLRLLFLLALTALWALASILVLRPSPEEPPRG